ncbi:hypothetical protein BWI15_12285 [Kribbella sp. ALI-6-A]|uniref:hypothetical protein n=1 Tax=Kribbella sp. ALI-6-A TaxID=1933817 RepID=UPI00097BB4CF|nr:hypothetical protein [Kribbella sp. ALI-6-A]ONI74140.1 hypothetical protein BWI15_12285 [Kribbella sp. ALI-6-A]
MIYGAAPAVTFPGGTGEAYAKIGMTAVRKGDDVYYVSPTPANYSDDKLVIQTVTPEKSSPGLDFVDAKVYKRADFGNVVPVSGGGQGNSLDSKLKSLPSQLVAGYKLDAGQLVDDVIYLHFHVTTDQRPLETSGVVFGYRQDGKSLTQTLAAVLQLEDASAGY